MLARLECPSLACQFCPAVHHMTTQLALPAQVWRVGRHWGTCSLQVSSFGTISSFVGSRALLRASWCSECDYHLFPTLPVRCFGTMVKSKVFVASSNIGLQGGTWASTAKHTTVTLDKYLLLLRATDGASDTEQIDISYMMDATNLGRATNERSS